MQIPSMFCMPENHAGKVDMKTKKKSKKATTATASAPKFKDGALSTALRVLDEIESASGKNAKQEALESNRNNKALQELLRMALCRTTFGMKPEKLEAYRTSQRVVGDLDSSWFLFHNLTQKLANRTLTGNDARDAVADFFAGMGKEKLAAKWFHRILAKNLRCGIDHTVSAVWPDLVIRWGVPKGMSLVDQKSNKIIKKLDAEIEAALPDGVDSQPKCDGVHGVAACDTGEMHSSSGDLYPAVNRYAKAIAEAVRSLDLPEIFDGHVPLVSGECEAEYNPKVDKKWSSTFAKGGAIAKFGRTATGYEPSRISAVMEKLIVKDFKFAIYDIYPDLAQREQVFIPRDVKRKLLKAVVEYCNDNAERLGIRKNAITLIPQIRCRTRQELKDAHKKWLALGYEGSILRLRKATTLADSKTRNISVNFFKWKEYGYFDGIIIGIKHGKKNTKNEDKGGSYIVWEPDAKQVLCVTIPTDKAKELASSDEAAQALTGYMIEAVKQKDAGGDVAVARFPTLSRFRDDLAPATEAELALIAKHPAVKAFGVVIARNQIRNTQAKRIVIATAKACNEKPAKKTKAKAK